MTSTADTTQHPDVSEISDLTEGLLSPSRTADLRRHLNDCALCADVRTSLEEIRGLLGTLPGPARMPADIAGRIDAALAAEALLDATAPAASEHVSRETSPPSKPTERTPADRPAGPSSGRPAGRPNTATGPGRAGSARQRRRRMLLGTAFGAALVALSGLLLQGIQSSGDKDGNARKADSPVTAADAATFSGVPLDNHVEALLAMETFTATPEKQDQRSLGANTVKRSGDVAVPDCVQAGTGRTEQALAAELGEYQGRKAFLVVLPHSADARRVDAYIVDASCTTTKASKGDVLLTHSYPRP
ncbi:hypothetical protein AB0A69_21630 [Streptomyces sp. NPDC045431]|uniref:hypothetical protein n=1 Tax=Streptomyces sp. NPDC045431 TaxID=3155613 RepID=UPI0033CAFA8A